MTPEECVAYVLELKEKSTDLLRLGRIKAVADGSIQGFSARMRWPGYHNGAPNGLWYTPPEQMSELYNLALAAGVQVHTHTNGDQATQMRSTCSNPQSAPIPALTTALPSSTANWPTPRSLPRWKVGNVREPVCQPSLLLGR